MPGFYIFFLWVILYWLPVTASFDVFALLEIYSIHCRKHISVSSSLFCSCFEIIQAWHPYIRLVQYSTPWLFFMFKWRCVYLLVEIFFCLGYVISVFLLPHLILKYCTQVFELIPLLEFIPVDKDVDLLTFIVLTYDQCLWFFSIPPQSFLLSCACNNSLLQVFLQLIQCHQRISSCLYSAVPFYFISWVSF